MRRGGLRLRPATLADADLLFAWANEPLVRRNSFHSEKIAYGEHIAWLENALASGNSFIFILWADNEPVGQIRVDTYCADDGRIEGRIDYSVAASWRGRGLGKELLSRVGTALPNLGAVRLIGEVKADNTASMRAFVSAGYEAEVSGGAARFCKRIKCDSNAQKSCGGGYSYKRKTLTLPNIHGERAKQGIFGKTICTAGRGRKKSYASAIQCQPLAYSGYLFVSSRDCVADAATYAAFCNREAA